MQFPQLVVRDQAVTVMDILPTICEVLDIELPDNKLNGKSLLPIIQSEQAATAYDLLYFQWQQSWAVREGDWKLIVNGRDNTGKFSPHPERETMHSLYLANLADEHPEEVNHAEEHPEIVERLTGLYEVWADDVFARDQQTNSSE